MNPIREAINLFREVLRRESEISGYSDYYHAVVSSIDSLARLYEDEATVELVARAICASNGLLGPFDELDQLMQGSLLDDARAALRALVEGEG